MKLSITYLYTIFKYGYPHSVDDAMKSLPEIRELGFRFMELEGLGPENLLAVYERRKELAARVKDCGLHVHNFCVVDPNLVSLDESVRRRALDGFRMGAEVASLLGAETLHLASYAPPVEYRERQPYQLSSDGAYQFENVTALRLPPGFSWPEVWRALVDSCRQCADIAAEYDRTVIMEPRVGEVICSVDSLLRLIDDVARPNFKANFDTAHFSAQRENVVLALAKLQGKFANVHIADNDPVNSEHVPIGEGSIDWPEFLRSLQASGYDGYLGIDLGLTDGLLDGYRRSVNRLKSIAKDLNLTLEV
ncbi:sugar phosphate isomerase/epimerase family protein [Planctomicrobium sp. SH661]|uniref:sugar phosphate isomerase/epimerase family protein n=1 Tax=Planctomicrobium sp. SH661 TaxID=3448124 RepID=UPI003F5C9713